MLHEIRRARHWKCGDRASSRFSRECTISVLKNFFNLSIAIKTRVKIMNSIVRSRLVYGCQTWALTKQLIRRMKSAYSGILRKMIKGGFRRKTDAWSFVLTNEDILRQCGTEDIEAFIRRLQRNNLAHIVRHDDSSISKRLTFDENGRRPGRHITMESMVHQFEQMDRDTFNRRAIERVF